MKNWFLRFTTSKNQSAFTLVELIVTITILSILGTVGFISLQGYSISARDSSRLTDLGSLERTLSLFKTEKGVYPSPDSSTTIFASGTILSYQGYAGSGVLGLLRVSDIKDPLDGESRYFYSTNASRTKFQLLGFFENKSAEFENTILPTAYAADYSKRFPITRGDPIGIFFESNNVPPTGTSIDIITTNNTTNYTSYFPGSESVSQSGTTLFQSVYNRRPDLLKDGNYAKFDSNLVGYWDMETTTLSGSKTVLKDLSLYGNNGECMNAGTSQNCGASGLGPQFAEHDKKNGKAMYFDGIDDWIRVNNDPRITFSGSITIVAKFKQTKICTDFVDGDPCLDTIIMKGGAFTPGFWVLNGYTGTKVLTEINGNAAGYYMTSNEKNTTNTTTLIFTKDQNTNKYFINGRLDRTLDTSYNLLNNSEFLTIGSAFASYNRVFDGLIDEIRIYNRALSDTEIQAMYQAMN